MALIIICMCAARERREREDFTRAIKRMCGRRDEEEEEESVVANDRKREFWSLVG